MSARTKGGVKRLPGWLIRKEGEEEEEVEKKIGEYEEEVEKKKTEEIAEYEKMMGALMKSIDEIAADENMLERQKKRFGEFLRATKRLGVDDSLKTRFCGVTPKKLLKEVQKDCECKQDWTLDMVSEMWSLHCHSRRPPFALGMDFGDKVKEAISRLLENDPEKDVTPPAVYDLLDDQTKASVPIAAVRGELTLLTSLSLHRGVHPQPPHQPWMRMWSSCSSRTSVMDDWPMLGLETLNLDDPVLMEKLRLYIRPPYKRLPPKRKIESEVCSKFEGAEKEARIKFALANGRDEYAKKLEGFHYKVCVKFTDGGSSLTFFETKPTDVKEDSPPSSN